MKRTLTLTMTALALTTLCGTGIDGRIPCRAAPLDKQRIEARAAVESRITTGAPARPRPSPSRSRCSRRHRTLARPRRASIGTARGAPVASS